MLNLYQINQKGLKMAELIITIENELHRYEYGLENSLITQKEYDELTSILAYELKLLASRI
jgi:hypothetical protein